ncbi:MAG TPA: DinB family protein [Saprospiraceae bacterium]|nr:DinB family protein [Saprospiraceae bacterium]HPI08472.1 DinB family protein [Saprospiraceae bacterium]
MLNTTLSSLFERDLRKLKDEINLYADESRIWIVSEGISNSAGNLCLHLLGNLNHFIGAVLGKTGYIRRRDDEFALKNIPRAELNAQIDATIEVVKTVMDGLSEADFQKDYPEEKRGEILKMDFMLLHLFGHLNYHLGQVNYHRRLLGQ